MKAAVRGSNLRTARRHRARFAAGLALAATAAAAAPPATARHVFRPTCRSGSTLFRHGAVRVFAVYFREADQTGHEAVLMCRQPQGRPVALDDPGPAIHAQASAFRIIGNRLAFETRDEGFSNGVETDVGWIDLRRGGPRTGVISVGEGAGPADPQWPESPVGYAIAQDGTMAVLLGDRAGCQVVGLLPNNARSRAGFLLAPTILLYSAPVGGLRTNSLTINRTTVSWRTVKGAAGSVPRTGGTRPAATRAYVSGGCQYY